MISDVITLVRIDLERDARGDLVEVIKSQRDVFAEVRSIGMKEFYQADATGMKPEHVFRLADYLDYNGEQLILWNDRRYQFLKSFRIAESSELNITVTSIVNQGGG